MTEKKPCGCDAGVQCVPMAVFESSQARHHSTVVYLVIAWLVSVAILGFALICSTSYEDTADVTTAETLTDVDQNATDNGSVYFSGGDMDYGGEADSQDDSTGN